MAFFPAAAWLLALGWGGFLWPLLLRLPLAQGKHESRAARLGVVELSVTDSSSVLLLLSSAYNRQKRRNLSTAASLEGFAAGLIDTARHVYSEASRPEFRGASSPL